MLPHRWHWFVWCPLNSHGLKVTSSRRISGRSRLRTKGGNQSDGSWTGQWWAANRAESFIKPHGFAILTWNWGRENPGNHCGEETPETPACVQSVAKIGSWLFFTYTLPVISSLTNLELGYVTRSLDQHLGPVYCDRKTIHLWSIVGWVEISNFNSKYGW